MELRVQDNMHEKEMSEHLDKVRGKILTELSYDSNESYGMSNDNIGPTSDAPLPYIPPTEQSDDGYFGLDPPVG